VTASTWGDPTQVAAGFIALFGSKSPAPSDRPQNFEELAQREKELTAMAGATPEGTKHVNSSRRLTLSSVLKTTNVAANSKTNGYEICTWGIHTQHLLLQLNSIFFEIENACSHKFTGTIHECV